MRHPRLVLTKAAHNLRYAMRLATLKVWGPADLGPADDPVQELKRAHEIEHTHEDAALAEAERRDRE
jgi:hypothetical protein